MTFQPQSKTELDGRCTLFVPMDLDLDLIPKRLRHECILLCSLIHRKWLNWQADKDGWVRLKSQHLRNLINDRKLYPVIDNLLELEVIERSNSYRSGRRSKAYRLHPRCRSCQTVTIENRKIKKRLQKLECPKLDLHVFLEKQLQNLDIDMKRAWKVIDTLEPNSDCELSVAEYRQLLWEQCRVFEQRHLSLSRDPYGRCHSPFTRLPRELRSCLTLRGEELVGFDLANSQPLFAGILSLIYYMGHANRLRQQTFDRQSRDIPSWHLEELKLRHISRGIPGGLTHTNTHELVHFLDVCQDGQFYESFPGDRDAIKKSMMPVLAGPPWYANSKTSRLFQERYPSVYKVLLDLKKHNDLPKNVRHKHVSHLLQNLEASMMIGSICGTAMKQNIPVITLHDGLYTCQRHYDSLLAIAKNKFSQLKVTPTFKPAK